MHFSGFLFFQYEGDDEKVFPVTEAGGWKAAEKTDLIGTWKVCFHTVIKKYQNINEVDPHITS